ncbi:hypothetical protein DFQ14_112142 [Halopolyspora algeriensis]|uniref:Uncharacterized protein n=1 Tax=Halopolyspora algeriensis TaxID=1500506 RepID=A0A368VML3_9ACTN|nr:IniB N-terminal domain-containing protein [Halopolyspora algeriensis]RCW40260.1 hypothetical protein DFQ14_112142 [Halopolyspora algeriensis]TQM46259.1 hypothetical protein FHU43_3929 [Halopolyspora algeriensis]
MLHSQSEQDPGSMHSTSAGAPTSNSGTQAAQADQPTLYEFLTQLVSNPQARSAFEADPRASLDGAGLGDMTATDVLQGASLVLDYAPAEVVQEYGRSLQSSVDTFAASTQHVAINQLHPAQEHEHQEATEPSMLQNSQDTSSNGDADEQMPADNGNNGGGNAEAGNNVEVNHSVEHTDSHNVVSVHDVLSDNSLAGVGNTVDSVGDTVNNTVNSVSSTVDAVGVNNVVGGVANVAVEDVVGNVTGAVGGVVGGVTGAGDVQTYGGDAEANAGLVGNVGGTVDGVTSGLGLDVL